jgi:hypothetical protein
MSQARVYSKTEAGIEEVQLRKAGLSARVRQLLILVDGKRNVTELSRLLGLVEFEEFLSLLELKGFIRPKDEVYAEVTASVLLDPNTFEVSLDPVRRSGQPSLVFNVLDTPVSETSQALLADCVVRSSAVSPRSSEGARLELDRSNMARLLRETAGPLAEDLSHRIGRASRRAELAELFVASLTVVELMSGRKSADRFVEKMKQMGWEV